MVSGEWSVKLPGFWMHARVITRGELGWVWVLG